MPSTKKKQETREGLSQSQSRELTRLTKLLAQQLSHHKREVSQLTTSSPSVPQLATVHLHKLIQSWAHQGRSDPRFGKAAEQLGKLALNLVHFARFMTAPASQQELESQNNRLKQVFRQQSGHVHSRYRFVYHAEGTSAALNIHAKTGDCSPLERLGIDLGSNLERFTDLRWIDLWQAKCYLMSLRKPRKDFLKVRHQGLKKLRQQSGQKWVKMVEKRIEPHQV